MLTTSKTETAISNLEFLLHCLSQRPPRLPIAYQPNGTDLVMLDDPMSEIVRLIESLKRTPAATPVLEKLRMQIGHQLREYTVVMEALVGHDAA